MLLFELSGLLFVRLEERTLFVLLFHAPPRNTRFVVSGSRPQSRYQLDDLCTPLLFEHEIGKRSVGCMTSVPLPRSNSRAQHLAIDQTLGALAQ